MRGDPMSIAKTILSQIKTLDFWAMGAWGAKDLVAMNDGLKFKTSGMVKWKGYVYVKYDYGQDLYDVIFARIRKMEWIEDEKVEGVYAEDLVNIISQKVG
jgi:hypothetical protein